MKRILTVLMILVLSISIVACTSDTKPPAETPAPETPTETPIEEPPVEKPEPVEETSQVTLYFANEEYVQSGDESLEKLVAEVRDIEIKDVTLEEAVVRELLAGPDLEGVRTVIPGTANLLGVNVEDKTAYVDFAREGMHGGSLEETFTINQIVASLTELDSVDRVQFLIDGEVEDSLMGHYDISKPFEAPIGE